jgi:hypothetical protein
MCGVEGDLRRADSPRSCLDEAKASFGTIQFHNRCAYSLLLLEGERLDQEIAARFEDGKEPVLGVRGRHSNQ